MHKCAGAGEGALGKKQLRSNASGISPHIHCGKWNLLFSATWPWTRTLPETSCSLEVV